MTGGDVRIRLTVDGQERAVGELRQTAGAIDAAAAAGTRAGSSLGGAADAGDRAAASLARVGHYGAGLLALGGLGQAVRSIAGLADEVATLNGRLRAVTDGQEQFARAQADVIGIAERQRKGLSEIATLYASASAAASELGATQRDVAQFTEGVAASLTLGGTSAQAAAGALLQLSQAVGGSVVQAQEFNSLIDGARPLLVAAAKHIDEAGGSVSRLKAMVNEGRLSSRDFFRAIVQASEELTAASAEMPTTIGQSLTKVRNEWLLLVGAIDSGTGASSAAAAVLGTLADNIGTLAVVAGGAAALGMGRLAQTTATAVQEALAQRAATLAGLAATVSKTEAVAIHTGFVLADARATLAHTTGLGASVAAQNAVIAASARHTAALAAQTAAQTALSRATSLGAAALGLLGGPIGLVVTALGLGATAWAAWSAASRRGNEEAAADTERSTQSIVADLTKQAEKLEALNRLRKQPGGAEVAKTGGDDAARLAELGDKIAEFTNKTGRAAAMNEAARQAVLQATLKEYAQVDAAIRRVAAAEAERGKLSREQQTSRYLEKYATDAERLSAALKQASADFGGIVPPEIKKRIEQSFTKPEKQGKPAGGRPADPLAERIALLQSAYGSGQSTAQEDFRRAELGEQEGVNRALAAAREADQAKAASAIDAARRAAEGITQANRAGNIALIADDRARVAAQVELEREHMLAMIEPLRAMPEEYAAALAGVNQAVASRTAELSRQLKDEATVFAEQAARNIQDTLGNTLEAMLSGNFKSIGKMWLDMLNRMVAQAAAADLGKALMGDYGKTGKVGGGLGGLLSGLAGIIGGAGVASGGNGNGGWSIGGQTYNNPSAYVGGGGFSFESLIGSIGRWFGGGRAEGGPVLPGATYLVGERGPELLRMGAMGGRAAPNGRADSGGRGGVQVVIENHGADVAAQPERGPDGEERLRIVVRQAVAQAHRTVAADFASGTGIASNALRQRGVDLGNASIRRA